MRDEKGKYSKHTQIEDDKKEYPENKITNNTHVFNLNFYSLGVAFITLMVVGYFIYKHFLFIYIDGGCASPCRDCNLNTCYDYITCFCRNCIDCLREAGFVMFM